MPPRDVTSRWADCVRSWAVVLDDDVNVIAGALTVKKLAKWVATLGTIDALQEQLTEPKSAMQWLQSFLALVCERRHTHLLDDCELLPNQNGDFKGRSKLRRDPGIDTELKDIAEGLNIPARDRLLHAEIAIGTLEELLDEESEEALLDQLLQRVKEKSQPPFIDGYVEANVRLFRFLAGQLTASETATSVGAVVGETSEERADLDKFDGFPVLCLEPNTNLALDRDEDSDAVPLAPVSA